MSENNLVRAQFDPLTDRRPETREEAVEIAAYWASGVRSWQDLGPEFPFTPDVIAVMDAQEVVKFAALASVLPSRPRSKFADMRRSRQNAADADSERREEKQRDEDELEVWSHDS